MESREEFPTMPTAATRSQTLEASASTIWTVLFFSYSSSTIISQFGHGWTASWTIGLVLLPILFAGVPNILDQRRNAVSMLAVYILYALTPALLQLFKPQDIYSFKSEMSDVLTVLVIWLPLEFQVLSKRFSPTGKVTAWGLLTAALNILNIFLVLRPFSLREHARELGYTFKFTSSDLLVSVVIAVIYICAILFIAVSTRFGKINLRKSLQLKPPRELATFLGMYMSVLTEELLFRGLIQNMLEQRTSPNSIVALILASLAYAAAHVAKKKLGFETPNYRFALCAFVAGLLCGIAWRITGKVTASALTHAIADYTIYQLLLSEYVQS